MFTWPTTASKSPQLSDMGSALLYYLVIKPISLLPYPLLYLVSDLTRLIVYRAVGYRRKVVASNIAGAFPDLSPRERVAIERKFYKHFCDLIVESLKNFSITEKQARKRMVERNPEVINRYASQGISTVMCGGHFNNWELWAVEAGLSLDPLVVGIYKRLSNPFFDKKMKDSRSKFGLMMIPTKEVGKEMKRLKDTVKTTVYAIDQSPANPQKAYWMYFLGRETACYYGPEKYARDHRSPVLFARIHKVKRGHYEVEYEPVMDRPEDAEYGEVIHAVQRMLEKDVRKWPEYWLWTHKRWKHQRPENVVLDDRP